MKIKFQYLKYPFLKKEIENMGYELKNSVFLKTFLLLYCAAGCIVYFYKLKISYAIFLFFICTISVPYHIYHEYKNQFQKKKYLDLTIYMEQMLYSFKRHPKILDALTDTSFVFANGSMFEMIEKARNMIQESDRQNLYRDALHCISEEYGCQRLYTLHDFLIKVEMRGGNFEQTADLLLDDRQRWKTSVELLDKEKKNKKKAINIVLISTLILCGIMVSVFSALEGIFVVDHGIYQIVSLLFVVCNLCIWLLSSNKLGESWELETDDVNSELLLRDYDYIKMQELKKSEKRLNRTIIIPIIFLIPGILMKNLVICSIACFYIYYLYHLDIFRLRRAKNHLKKELKKIFPQWLMELTLLLQTENVYVGLTKSLEFAPEILAVEIKKLLVEIDELPNSVQPYHNFFRNLNMEEITTSMKILYSISAYDSKTKDSPLNHLIERNHVMLNKAQQLKGNEKLAVWTTCSYIPMAAGGIKIILDMVLLIASLVSNITTFG